MKKSNKRFIFFILIFAVTIFFVIKNYYSFEKSWYIDFKVNYKSGFRMVKGIDLYNKIPYNGGYTYLPVVSVFYYSLVKLNDYDLNKSKFFWFTFNIICMIGCLFLCYELKIFKNKGLLSIFLFITVFLFYKPATDNLKYGNIKIVLLFLYFLLAYVLIHKKDLFAGFVWGLLIILSIQPVVLGLYFLIKKKYKIILSAFLFIVLIINLSLFLIPFSQYEKYIFTVIPNLFFEGASASPYIQSIDAMFKRFFLEANEYTIEFFSNNFLALKFPVIVKIIILVITTYYLWKFRKIKDNNLLQFNLLFLTSILIHSINWEYHYTLLLLTYSMVYKQKNYFRLKSFPNIIILILFLINAMNFPYDHQFFKQGFFMIFTNIKLYALTGLYIYIIYMLKSNSLKYIKK